MYAQYDGLIFDMDGTLLDTEPTHRQAWTDVLGRYGMRFDLQAMIALNGSPTWRIAQAVIELNQAAPARARKNRCGKSHAFRYRTSSAAD